MRKLKKQKNKTELKRLHNKYRIRMILKLWVSRFGNGRKKEPTEYIPEINKSSN